MVCSFFLGANTPDGFYSLFDELNGFDLSVIKGSCGSGKSTLLKNLIEKSGCDGMCERVLCASDLNSLDGVIFHGRNAAAVDGTMPHTAETAGLGIYIIMPPPRRGIEKEREAIAALKTAKAGAYKLAYRCLNGARYAQNCASMLIGFDSQKLIRRADGIIDREAKPKGANGRLHRRFIDAFTPDGVVTLTSTVSALAKRIYVIEDRLALASPLLKELQSRLLERGYEVYSCLSPMYPEKVRHLIVPELQLAFVTSDRLKSFDCTPFRRLHLTAYTDQNSLRANKVKIRLFEKLSDELTEQAFCELKAARQAHSMLESLYLPYLDIPALKELNDNITLG